MTTVIQWLAKLQFQYTHPLLPARKREALLSIASAMVREPWVGHATIRAVALSAAHTPDAHDRAQRMLELSISYAAPAKRPATPWDYYTFSVVVRPSMLGGWLVTVRKVKSSRMTKEEVQTAKAGIAEAIYCWLTTAVTPGTEASLTAEYNRCLSS